MRNPAIELYRCLLMLGICMMHSFNEFWGGPSDGIMRALFFCVPGFVFISGYYGIRFSISKLLKLYAIGYYCCYVSTVILLLFNEGLSVLFSRLGTQFQLLSTAWSVLCNQCWFLHAYAVVMFFAPLINAAFELPEKVQSSEFRVQSSMFKVQSSEFKVQSSEFKVQSSDYQIKVLKIGLPILFVVFGWSWWLEVPVIRKMVWPKDGTGFGEYTALTLIGVYVAARMFRLLELENKVKLRWFFMALPFLLMATQLQLGGYNSPVALILAAGFFTVFLKIGQRKHVTQLTKFNSFILFLVPSLFSVYLLHGHGHLVPVMNAIECHMPIPGFLTGIIVFFGCIVIDFPRRFVLNTVRTFTCKKSS